MTYDLILTIAMTCTVLSGIGTIVIFVREIQHERNGTTPKE